MKSKSFYNREETKYIDPNETFVQKIIRLWDYYKFFILLGVFLVVICVVLTLTFTNKKGIDAYIFFITSDDSMCFSTEEDADPFCKKYSSFLEQYGIDFSGDGKVRIEVDIVYIGESKFYDQIAEINKQKAKNALMTGTCMCFIADKKAFEYIYNELGNLEKIDYLVGNNTCFDGYGWCLNNSEIAVKELGLSDNNQLYIALRKYYGTVTPQLYYNTTANFKNGEQIIKKLFDPEFNPETDTIEHN